MPLPVDRGDLIDISRRLRAVVEALDNAGYALEKSFTAISPHLEDEAEKARRTLQLASQRVTTLAQGLERSRDFAAAVAERKNKP